jgi:hypothetical protein
VFDQIGRTMAAALGQLAAVEEGEGQPGTKRAAGATSPMRAHSCDARAHTPSRAAAERSP